jgi:hypothetical protein
MGMDAYIVSFADFPSDLDAVMGDDAKRSELYKALILVQDKDDIRIVTTTDYWYLPMGSKKWKSQPLDSSTQNTKIVRDSSLNKPLFISGIGVAALGTASLVLAQNQYNTFNSSDETMTEDEINSAA